MADRAILIIGDDKMKKLIKILIISFLTLPIMSCAVVHHYGAYYGKVVDAETKEPLEGAAVVAVYKTQQYGFAGPIARFADAQETVTDKNGEFKIPSNTVWTFRPLQSFEPYAYFTIFKPSYGCYPRFKGVKRIVPDGRWRPEQYLQYLPHNQYVIIELPRLRTKEERLQNYGCYPSGQVPEIKYKNLFQLIQQERMVLGLEPRQIQK